MMGCFLLLGVSIALCFGSPIRAAEPDELWRHKEEQKKETQRRVKFVKNKVTRRKTEVSLTTKPVRLSLLNSHWKGQWPEQVISLDFSRLGLMRFPEEICEFSNLEELYLSFNQLISLPDRFSCFPKLKTLNLSYNRLVR